MKALYSNERECQQIINEGTELTTYNYDSRWQALKEGFKFVHLFETHIDDCENKNYKYYSTMQMYI